MRKPQDTTNSLKAENENNGGFEQPFYIIEEKHNERNDQEDDDFKQRIWTKLH